MADDAIETNDGWRIDPASLSWRFSRASGPGGQHVNTTDSRVELTCDIARAGLPEHIAARLITRHGEQLRVVASTTRSQRRNRDDAVTRLAAMVDAAALTPRQRRPTKPSRGAVERRIDAKKHTSARKQQRQASRGWRSVDDGS